MFTVANRLYIAEDFRDTFEEKFRQRISSLREQEGFVRLNILRPVGDSAPYVVHTTWQSQQAFKTWVASPDFAEAHANPMPKEAFTAKGSMEQHEIVVSSD